MRRLFTRLCFYFHALAFLAPAVSYSADLPSPNCNVLGEFLSYKFGFTSKQVRQIEAYAEKMDAKSREEFLSLMQLLPPISPRVVSFYGAVQQLFTTEIEFLRPGKKRDQIFEVIRVLATSGDISELKFIEKIKNGISLNPEEEWVARVIIEQHWHFKTWESYLATVAKFIGALRPSTIVEYFYIHRNQKVSTKNGLVTVEKYLSDLSTNEQFLQLQKLVELAKATDSAAPVIRALKDKILAIDLSLKSAKLLKRAALRLERRRVKAALASIEENYDGWRKDADSIQAHAQSKTWAEWFSRVIQPRWQMQKIKSIEHFFIFFMLLPYIGHNLGDWRPVGKVVFPEENVVKQAMDHPENRQEGLTKEEAAKILKDPNVPFEELFKNQDIK